jgi:GcrA cell cycle regulator
MGKQIFPAIFSLVRSPGHDIEPSARKLANGSFVTTETLSSRTCRWPFGNPVESSFHYCGQPPSSGRPYCSAHEQAALAPSVRSR